MTTAAASDETLRSVWRWLADVPDPEIPVISVVDLGIVRDVRWNRGVDPAELVVTVTPTYSGCPATEVIADSIRATLREHGVEHAVLETRLSPAWTTDWLSAGAHDALRVYGIAPPGPRPSDDGCAFGKPVAPSVACPRCDSSDTELVSRFGSTPCKALYRCRGCREPFDHFKCH